MNNDLIITNKIILNKVLMYTIFFFSKCNKTYWKKYFLSNTRNNGQFCHGIIYIYIKKTLSHYAHFLNLQFIAIVSLYLAIQTESLYLVYILQLGINMSQFWLFSQNFEFLILAILNEYLYSRLYQSTVYLTTQTSFS